MNTDAKIRGYSVKRQADFIRSSHFDDATRKRVLESLPPRLQGNLDEITAADWYPWSDSVLILRAIASTRSDDASARQLLATCGEWIALDSLVQGFGNVKGAQALLAYLESRAAIELIETRRAGSMAGFLARGAAGEPWEQALRAETGWDTAGLEDAMMHDGFVRIA